MLEGIETRGRKLGERAAARVRRRLAARVRGEIAGVGVEETDRGVVLTGRRLGERLIGDPRLRWIGEWLR